MPRRISEFRLLAEPLRAYLSEPDVEGNDRWPKYKELFRFLRESLDWSGSEREYKALKKNGAGPARLVEGLLEYLCLNARRRVVEFSGRVGGEPPHSLTHLELIERYSSLCDESQVRTDWRREGWRGLSGMFAAALLGVDERCLCRSADEVRDLVRWAMTDVGRALDGDPLGKSSGDEAHHLATAETHMRRSLAHFQSQAMDWWEACPWTVLKAVYGDEIVGGSIVLPLRRECYERLCAEQLSDLEVTADCLQYPSRWLLGEAIANSIPRATGVRVGWASARQVTTIVYQVARLSYAPPGNPVAGLPISVTCVGGTPDASERLRRHGYREIGLLKGFDVPLYELVMPAPEKHGWLPTSAGKAYSSIVSVCHSQIRQAEES